MDVSEENIKSHFHCRQPHLISKLYASYIVLWEKDVIVQPGLVHPLRDSDPPSTMRRAPCFVFFTSLQWPPFLPGRTGVTTAKNQKIPDARTGCTETICLHNRCLHRTHSGRGLSASVYPSVKTEIIIAAYSASDDSPKAHLQMQSQGSSAICRWQSQGPSANALTSFDSSIVLKEISTPTLNQEPEVTQKSAFPHRKQKWFVAQSSRHSENPTSHRIPDISNTDLFWKCKLLPVSSNPSKEKPITLCRVPSCCF